MGGGGLEPPQPLSLRILSPLRLPISPTPPPLPCGPRGSNSPQPNYEFGAFTRLLGPQERDFSLATLTPVTFTPTVAACGRQFRVLAPALSRDLRLSGEHQRTNRCERWFSGHVRSTSSG